MKTKDSKNKNLAYKAVLTKGGLLLLFEKITHFKEEDVKINYFQGDIYVELGDNIFLLTNTIIDQLFQYPKIFLSIGKAENYEMLDLPYEFEIDDQVLAQIKGAVSVIEATIGNTD
ncbi:MAG: hypothetical protein M1510_11925 [Nitrospirae bacterium]|nr:hypothetical protein [Nitrospirota bacterium]MCL5237068.1 hypothetical protein [Nitrospirota bacterium]